MLMIRIELFLHLKTSHCNKMRRSVKTTDLLLISNNLRFLKAY